MIEPNPSIRGDYQARQEALNKALLPFVDPVETENDLDVHVTQAVAIKKGQVQQALEALRKNKSIEASVLTDVLKKRPSSRAAEIMGDFNSQGRAMEALEAKMRLAAQMTGVQAENETWQEEAKRVETFLANSIDFQNARNMFQMNLVDLRVRAHHEGDYRAEFAIMAFGGTNSLLARMSKNPMNSRDIVNRMFNVIDRAIDTQLTLAGERLKLGKGAIAAERASWGGGSKFLEASDVQELMHYGSSDIKDLAFRLETDTDVNEFLLFGNPLQYKELFRMLISANPEVARFTHQRL
ncbi:MAG: hypothetical protein EOP05_05040, partial [Proteobacteria bacterium]